MGGALPSARRPPTRRGGADLQREGWSLTLGAPAGGGTRTTDPGTRWGRLPSSLLRLSQDSNIFSTYFTDGTGRLRYIPDAREDKYLASIAGLSLRCGTMASGRVQLRRGGESAGNGMNHHDHTYVPSSHAARDRSGDPRVRDSAAESNTSLYRRGESLDRGFSTRTTEGPTLAASSVAGPYLCTLVHHGRCQPMRPPSVVGTLLPRRVSTPNRGTSSPRAGLNHDRSFLLVFL
jgi:hypothetical protein